MFQVLTGSWKEINISIFFKMYLGDWAMPNLHMLEALSLAGELALIRSIGRHDVLSYKINLAIHFSVNV